ncbi:hypothetical protein M8C21_009118 [Ambrosia artemisiifolia]|uniref:Uncharacterized protein n=1 Tax=Ambrosia artemisiifolia TaxID=4212 RepID=A0AAD5CW44_AMBAR|nr:hypothetical protein M8C21_009118 [Ambrosia artemisiifolia]
MLSLSLSDMAFQKRDSAAITALEPQGGRSTQTMTTLPMSPVAFFAVTLSGRIVEDGYE